MSKKHHVEDLEDLDDSAYELLGNKVSRLARDGQGKESHGKGRFRERRASDQDYYAPSPKVRRNRDKH